MTLTQAVADQMHQFFTIVRLLDAPRLKTYLEESNCHGLNVMAPGLPGHAALHELCSAAIKRYRSPSSAPSIQRDAAARCARELIAFGAAVNALNAEGSTPLMLALLSHNLPLIEVLLEEGARMDLCSADGANAFHFAAREGDARVMRTLLRRAGTLQSSGCEASCREDGTPMQAAAMLGHTDAVAVLLDYKLGNSHGITYPPAINGLPDGLDEKSAALWLALAIGNTDVVRYLVRQNVVIAHGETNVLLYLAARGTDAAGVALNALIDDLPTRTRLTLLLDTHPECVRAITDQHHHRATPALAAALDRVLQQMQNRPSPVSERRHIATTRAGAFS